MDQTLKDLKKVVLDLMKPQIAELQNQTVNLETYCTNQNDINRGQEKEINELRGKVDAWIDDIRIGNKQRFRLEEILRDHYKQKIEKGERLIDGYFVDDEEVGTEVAYIKDDLEFFKRQLEKLDSNKTNHSPLGNRFNKQFKKDSEVLKDIKKLAKAESDFYDKHGYFSFWSDKLKVQRIKEQAEKKEYIDPDMEQLKKDGHFFLASGGDLDKILVIRDDLLKLYNIASYYRPDNEDLNKIRKRIKEAYGLE